jgi:hypothetical protein
MAFDPSKLIGAPDWIRDHLILSALAPTPTALAAWQPLVEAGIPNSPVAERWLPLIGWRLRHAELIPPIRRRLAAAHREAWVANTRLWLATAPPLASFDAAGIDWMLLKGAALAWSVYESAAHRPIGDVDVLVRPHHAAAAHALLRAEGWRAEKTTTDGQADAENGLHSTNYAKGAHGSLDLHAHALREGCGMDADNRFWARSVRATFEGRPVRLLSPADQLLHVCVHGLRWTPVRSCHWLADAATIITHAGNTLDWAAFIDESHRRQLAYQLYGALDLVSRITGVAVPAPVIDGLRPQGAPWFERLERRVKTRALYGPSGMLLMWYDWRRLRAARTNGQAPGFPGYLAQSMRLSSSWAIVPHVVGLLMDHGRSSRQP